MRVYTLKAAAQRAWSKELSLFANAAIFDTIKVHTSFRFSSTVGGVIGVNLPVPVGQATQMLPPM